MNNEMKLKRPEDVDALYAELTKRHTFITFILNETEPYRILGELKEYYGELGSTTCEHTFNFIWLILCIEGYES